MTAPKEAVPLANNVAEALDADVLIYNGPILRDWDRQFICLARKRRRRPNVLLLLVTEGGDADAAFRIARCLQNKYKKFSCLLPGYCKSAGTLIALGAHELIPTDNGELGPIDVQMSKRDDLWEMESGQVVMTSLATLQEKAFLSFEHFFLTMNLRGGGRIRLVTAGEIATKLTTGLFAGIYSQVDPKHIGEAGRAMSIAFEYGRRLRAVSKNFSLESLQTIVSGYPSHGFVIDRREMRQHFINMRQASALEKDLLESLKEMAYEPNVQPDDPVFEFLSTEIEEPKADAEKEPKHESEPGPAGPGSRQAAAAAGTGSS